MKTFVFSTLLLLVITTMSVAQKDQTIFDISSIKFTGAWGGPHIGISGYDGDVVFQSGVFAELEFNKNLIVGWQTYRFEIPDLSPNEDDFTYNGLVLGIIPYADKAIHPRASVSFGPGSIDLVNSGAKDNVFVIQPSGGVEANVFQWFRIGAIVGYRAVLDSDVANVSNQDLSSFFGELRFKFGFSWGE